MRVRVLVLAPMQARSGHAVSFRERAWRSPYGQHRIHVLSLCRCPSVI